MGRAADDQAVVARAGVVAAEVAMAAAAVQGPPVEVVPRKRSPLEPITAAPGAAARHPCPAYHTHTQQTRTHRTTTTRIIPCDESPPMHRVAARKTCSCAATADCFERLLQSRIMTAEIHYDCCALAKDGPDCL